MSEFAVNDSGLLTVYAACPAHFTAIRNGVMFAASTDPARGLIGLQEGNDSIEEP